MIIRQRRPLLDERLCGLRYSPSKVLLNNLKSASPGGSCFSRTKKCPRSPRPTTVVTTATWPWWTPTATWRSSPVTSTRFRQKKLILSCFWGLWPWLYHSQFGSKSVTVLHRPTPLMFFFNSQDAWRGWPTQAALCVAAGVTWLTYTSRPLCGSRTARRLTLLTQRKIFFCRKLTFGRRKCGLQTVRISNRWTSPFGTKFLVRLAWSLIQSSIASKMQSVVRGEIWSRRTSGVSAPFSVRGLSESLRWRGQFSDEKNKLSKWYF